MRTKRNICLIILVMVCSFILFSCRKFVNIPPPKNQIVGSKVFTDSANATAAVLGIYLTMSQNFSVQLTTGGLSVYCGLSADEIYNTTNNTDENDFYAGNVLPANGLNRANFWLNGYKSIYSTNACIEGLKESQSLTQVIKNRLLGEAKFARAFLYFNLVNLYGALPLVTTTDYHINMVLARVSPDSIYKQIIADLKDAQSLLPTSYATTGRFRPNQYTADALLSKVYLYQRDWTKTEDLATQIINSGIYSLESSLDNIYKSTTNEAIWKLGIVYPGVETWEGYFFIPANNTIVPKYVITNTLLGAFENGDQRKSKWLKANIVNNQTYYYPYKYKLGQDGNTTPLEHYIVFRLAEQYLIRAEARAQQGNLTGAVADLNVIRSRAILPILVTTLTQPEVFAAIEQERRIELFCEWGNRWFDLKRNNRADAVLGLLKGNNWQSSDMLYPIPQLEINNNPFLTQNTGY